jgi:hypothetical protein
LDGARAVALIFETISHLEPIKVEVTLHNDLRFQAGLLILNDYV